jgi:hypothetical protein
MIPNGIEMKYVCIVLFQNHNFIYSNFYVTQSILEDSITGEYCFHTVVQDQQSIKRQTRRTSPQKEVINFLIIQASIICMYMSQMMTNLYNKKTYEINVSNVLITSTISLKVISFRFCGSSQ